MIGYKFLVKIEFTRFFKHVEFHEFEHGKLFKTFGEIFQINVNDLSNEDKKLFINLEACNNSFKLVSDIMKNNISKILSINESNIHIDNMEVYELMIVV